MNEVSERLSFFAALYQVDEHPLTGMWLLYGTIVVLSVIVFKLGFAKQAPVLKARQFISFSCSGAPC